MIRRLIFNSRRYGSQLTQNKKNQLLKDFDPIEFESFKFEQEKDKYYSGFSLTDLYGKSKILAISPTLKKEMYTDNIFFVLTLLLTFWYLIEKRRRIYEYRLAYNKYRKSKLSYNPYN